MMIPVFHEHPRTNKPKNEQAQGRTGFRVVDIPTFLFRNIVKYISRREIRHVIKYHRSQIFVRRHFETAESYKEDFQAL